MSSSRHPICFNPDAQPLTTSGSESESTDLVSAFHRKLPGYEPTRLVPLDDLAKELGVAAVYYKEESNRMGVPSFKILGASWGTFRALADKLKLPLDCDVATIKDAAKLEPYTLFAATAGNHGRAVARVGSIFGLPVEIFVPAGTHSDTIRFIASEGARVTVVPGSYDDAVRTAGAAAETDSGILIQDTAWPGYEDIPNWIVAGYTTLLAELPAQLPARHAHPTHILVPVGVGSFASSVVLHFKSPSESPLSPPPAIIAVEPDAAACLHASLTAHRPVSVPTASSPSAPPTILAGLNCGTLSSTAWPVLAAGVAAAVTVSDRAAHGACEWLTARGVDAGPCGAAGVAALRRCCGERDARETLGLGAGAVVLVLGTEGRRGYEVPQPDAVAELLGH
ncbi:diaminopropionate ammonia-lyase family protein [Mycena belliarum]|uniref:Diaminopropionate ammonia-lyase family protein n=1 Tax=Mycena belliarum TaxID=1033014 RepID=A0AAD6XS39_9AGAR|nr:diaminopropionate ammonia-lyase family protein [Mycena belliae]